VRPYCDINWTLKRIIEEGELFAKQADTSLDFRRFDTALKEYVKATIIAAEVIPLHRDYPNLQLQNAELHRRYIGLTKRINKQGPAITKVKDMIKENNMKSGIQPGVNWVSPGTAPTIERGGDNGPASSVPSQVADVNGASARKKAPPPVQPKPEALHGKAINVDSHAPSQVDLAARFARLRTPEPSSPVQDPRIRTRPIIVPESAENETPATPSRNNVSIARPIGPREMPSVPATTPHPTKISLDVKFPVMPRLPDAVYSPDRGTDSAAIPNLKTSTSSFPTNGRNNSAPPISTVGPTPLLLDQKDDYFSPPHTIDGSSSPTGPNKRKSLSLPESTIMTAEELVNLQASLRILFVDLRSRAEFDSGHIMSRSIVCVEPIILRPGISGDQLGDSMVLAPDFEQDLYNKRQEFDLVVVYDQDSTSAKSSTTKIQDFMLAVYDYGYEKRVKQHPVLLIGGLDAWIDLLGPSSLQSTNTGSSSTSKNGPGKSVRPLNRSVVQRDSRYAERNRQRAHSLRQLPREEQLKWDATLRESTAHEDLTAQPESTSEEIINYARTTEDFFRRYPELPSIQESMTSPVPPLSSSYQKLDDELRSLTPKPPTRPAPALPRQRSSGISDRRLLVSPAHAAPSSSQNQSIGNTTVVPGLTGLVNKNIMCYSLSVVQALSATVFLRDLLRNFVYPPSQPIPRRGQEPGSSCPQFMMRCLGNLMGHLWCGVYHNVTPNTFLVSLCSYMNVLHFLISVRNIVLQFTSLQSQMGFLVLTALINKMPLSFSYG
jgi:ubiquitin carboxyl-terminal hydrolase 8